MRGLKNIVFDLFFENSAHLLWVFADVRVGADPTAVELVLAAGPKDLEIKCLVIVAKLNGGEVHPQGHLSIGRHNPPEVIQPETTTRAFKVTMLPVEGGSGELAGTGPVPPGLGMAGCKASLQDRPAPLCWCDGCASSLSLVAVRPTW